MRYYSSIHTELLKLIKYYIYTLKMQEVVNINMNVLRIIFILFYFQFVELKLKEIYSGIE